MLARRDWETIQYGTPEDNDYIISAEYNGKKGSILCQLYKENDYYRVRFTATKAKRLLPTIQLIPTINHDKALRFANNGMEELEKLINDDDASNNRDYS